MTHQRCALAMFLTLPAAAAQAQAPLSIEQLLAKPERWQLIAAANQRSAGSGAFDEQLDRELSLALRYGVNARLELNAAVQQGSRRVRAGALSVETVSEVFAVGVNWLALAEADWPALLLQLRASCPTGPDTGRCAGAGLEVAATAYRSIDPLVLSVSVAAFDQRPFPGEEGELAPGASWRIEPLVSFAVNPQVTLSGGFRLQRSTAARLDGQPLPARRALTALSAAVGYAPDRRSTIFVTGELASGAAGGALGLQWFYQF